jgi:hypothetical protein
MRCRSHSVLRVDKWTYIRTSQLYLPILVNFSTNDWYIIKPCGSQKSRRVGDCTFLVGVNKITARVP